MTSDSQWAVRQTLYATLSGDAGVTALVPAARIFDHVPQTSDYPYLVIGEMTLAEFDSKNSDGAELTVTLHVWSQYRGLKECERIMAAVVDALDSQALSIAGHALVLCRFEFSETMLDPDGLTRHGVQRFRIVTEAT